jgi:hypothetical protein
MPEANAAIDGEGEGADIVLLVVGDHFSFVRGRKGISAQAGAAAAKAGSLVGLVDKALRQGERDLAEAFLGLEGGHGRIVGVDTEEGEAEGKVGGDGAMSWMVDTATHPWQEGLPLRELILGHGSEGDAKVTRAASATAADPFTDFLGWTASLGGRQWRVLESSFPSPEALDGFLRTSQKGARKAAAAAFSAKRPGKARL